MTKFALDTNAISYLIQGNKSMAKHLNEAVTQGDEIIIPPIAYYEIRRGFKHKSSPGKELAFSLICKAYKIGEMNLSAWETAANIYGETRKAGNPVEDTDILMAAFCITNNYVLVTNNVKHFKDIDGLIIENWIE